MAINRNLTSSLDGTGCIHRVVRASPAESLGLSSIVPPPVRSVDSVKAQLACETGSWHVGDLIRETDSAVVPRLP